MLINLQIENVALIEKTEIHFQPGLNILTGETGAGKSMLIDSLHFALGGRFDRDFVRQGEKQAQVSALFITQNEELVSRLLEKGIALEEDGAVLLSRSMNDMGKTVCRINGRTVTIGMLRELSEDFIDIHGQHAYQSLLNPAKHIVLLDRFCQEELEPVLKAYQHGYEDYLNLEREYQELYGSGGLSENDKEFLQFQADEISAADLKLGEEETLQKRRQTLLNGEKLKKLSQESMALLYDGTQELPGASDLAAKALDCVNSLSMMDESVKGIFEALESATVQMDDCIRELRRYEEGIETDEQSLITIENRLQEIYRLKKKYGGTIENVLEFEKELLDKLDFINHRQQRIAQMKKKHMEAFEKASELAASITEIRKKKAVYLEKEIEQQLNDLEMKHARFKILVSQKETLTSVGQDFVEFLISPNQGEDLKPLAKIASGGEMSRVMLALKTILADADTIETFIFDEIDSGVSGRTAQKVAKKLSEMGERHQIISITHLPQIAAMADAHYLIEKSAKGQKTVTAVTALEEEAAVLELARLIGGTTISQSTLLAASDLKFQAKQLKRS